MHAATDQTESDSITKMPIAVCWNFCLAVVIRFVCLKYYTFGTAPPKSPGSRCFLDTRIIKGVSKYQVKCRSRHP